MTFDGWVEVAAFSFFLSEHLFMEDDERKDDKALEWAAGAWASIKKDAMGPHFGDCVKQANTCARCLYEECFTMGRKIARLYHQEWLKDYDWENMRHKSEPADE